MSFKLIPPDGNLDVDDETTPADDEELKEGGFKLIPPDGNLDVDDEAEDPIGNTFSNLQAIGMPEQVSDGVVSVDKDSEEGKLLESQNEQRRESETLDILANNPLAEKKIYEQGPSAVKRFHSLPLSTKKQVAANLSKIDKGPLSDVIGALRRGTDLGVKSYLPMRSNPEAVAKQVVGWIEANRASKDYSVELGEKALQSTLHGTKLSKADRFALSLKNEIVVNASELVYGNVQNFTRNLPAVAANVVALGSLFVGGPLTLTGKALLAESVTTLIGENRPKLYDKIIDAAVERGVPLEEKALSDWLRNNPNVLNEAKAAAWKKSGTHALLSPALTAVGGKFLPKKGLLGAASQFLFGTAKEGTTEYTASKLSGDDHQKAKKETIDELAYSAAQAGASAATAYFAEGVTNKVQKKIEAKKLEALGKAIEVAQIDKVQEEAKVEHSALKSVAEDEVSAQPSPDEGVYYLDRRLVDFDNPDLIDGWIAEGILDESLQGNERIPVPRSVYAANQDKLSDRVKDSLSLEEDGNTKSELEEEIKTMIEGLAEDEKESPSFQIKNMILEQFSKDSKLNPEYAEPIADFFQLTFDGIAENYDIDLDGKIDIKFKSGDLKESGRRGQYDLESREITIDPSTADSVATYIHEAAHAFLHSLDILARSKKTPKELKVDLDNLKETLSGADGREKQETFARGFESLVFTNALLDYMGKNEIADVPDETIKLFELFRDLYISSNDMLPGANFDGLEDKDKEVIINTVLARKLSTPLASKVESILDTISKANTLNSEEKKVLKAYFKKQKEAAENAVVRELNKRVTVENAKLDKEIERVSQEILAGQLSGVELEAYAINVSLAASSSVVSTEGLKGKEKKIVENFNKGLYGRGDADVAKDPVLIEFDAFIELYVGEGVWPRLLESLPADPKKAIRERAQNILGATPQERYSRKVVSAIISAKASKVINKAFERIVKSKDVKQEIEALSDEVAGARGWRKSSEGLLKSGINKITMVADRDIEISSNLKAFKTGAAHLQAVSKFIKRQNDVERSLKRAASEIKKVKTEGPFRPLASLLLDSINKGVSEEDSRDLPAEVERYSDEIKKLAGYSMDEDVNFSTIFLKAARGKLISLSDAEEISSTIEDLLSLGKAFYSKERDEKARQIIDVASRIKRNFNKAGELKSKESPAQTLPRVFDIFLIPEQLVRYSLGRSGVRLLLDPANKGEIKVKKLMDEQKDDLSEAVKEIAPWLRTYKKVGKYTHEEIFAILLNFGNEDNKEKMAQSLGLTVEKLTEQVRQWERDKVLTKKHFEAAQKVWDSLEKALPEYLRAWELVYGRKFKKIPASSFKTLDGTEYRGGYYPIIRIGDRGFSGEIRARKNQKPGNRGKIRESSNDPISLKLNDLISRVAEGAVFVGMSPAARDWEMLNSFRENPKAETEQEKLEHEAAEAFQKIKERIGPEKWRNVIEPTIADALNYKKNTNISPHGANFADPLFRGLINRVRNVYLVGNLFSAIVQVTGLVLALPERYGGLITARAGWYFIQEMAPLKGESYKQMRELFVEQGLESPLKQENRRLQSRNIIDKNVLFSRVEKFNELSQKIGEAKATKLAKDYLHDVVYSTQTSVSFSLFRASFDTYMEKYPGISADEAARRAAIVVNETQSSQMITSLSVFQRGNFVSAIFTSLVSHFISQANREINFWKKAGAGDLSLGRVASGLALRASATVVSEGLVALLYGRDFGDLDGDEKVDWWEAIRVAVFSYLSVVSLGMPILGAPLFKFILGDQGSLAPPLISTFEKLPKNSAELAKKIFEAIRHGDARYLSDLESNDFRDLARLLYLFTGESVAAALTAANLFSSGNRAVKMLDEEGIDTPASDVFRR